jgi:hypothetical protein
MFPVPARLAAPDSAEIEVKQLWENLTADGSTQVIVNFLNNVKMLK